ncbi:MAG: DUF1707 SHOCT-like domain-containing protein [Candidatus Corynebacterium faecigallinarum]
MDAPPPSDRLRLSDADRIHALTSLGGHYADGRLHDSEFNERSAGVADARTIGDLRGFFDDLPDGAPFDSTGSAVALPEQGSGVARVDDPDAAELESLRRRGKMINTLDGVILGATLVSYLLLQFVFDVTHAWVVWPSLALTLTLPRMILKYSDEDEELYDELQETEQETRKERLRRAAKRVHELEPREDSQEDDR